MYEVSWLIGYWMMLHDCLSAKLQQVPGEQEQSTHCHADTSHDANASQRCLRCARHQQIIYLLEIQPPGLRLLTPKPQHWDTVRRRQSDGEMNDQRIRIRVDVVMPELVVAVSRRKQRHMSISYHRDKGHCIRTMISGVSEPEPSSTCTLWSSSPSFSVLFFVLVGLGFEICRLCLMTSCSPDQRTLSQSVPPNLSKHRCSKASHAAWKSASLMEGNVSRNAITF
jgi:hypothetical protein